MMATPRAFHSICLVLLVLASSTIAFLPTNPPRMTLTTRSATENDEATPEFAQLGLGRDALAAVNRMGWTAPTPIQALAIPHLLADTSAVWAEAPTGAGKTACFGLPLLQLSMARRSGGVTALVVCPTRELAEQTGQVLERLASAMSARRSDQARWKVMVVSGGQRIEPQVAQLASYVDTGKTLDVLVATPGRLVDIVTEFYDNPAGAEESALERRLLTALERSGKNDLSLETIQKLQLDRNDDEGRGKLSTLFDNLQFFCLDEADRLLGRGFQSEMDSLMALLPPRVQTWLFSATFPKSIEPRVDTVLKRLGCQPPVRITCASSDRRTEDDVSASLQKRLARVTEASQSVQQTGSASTIDLRTIRLDKGARTQVLRRLLEQDASLDRVLVFVATRYASEHVSRKLQRAGINSIELHGKLDQDARARRLRDFTSGKTRVLIATDVASRGLDVEGLPAVVNYDLPRSTSDWVHRVGRTGRAGRQGTAITFVTAASEAQYDLIEKRHLAEPVEREVLPGFEPNEEQWALEAQAARLSVPGVKPSDKGLAHDRMFGGIKGRRKSKKDRLREQAAAKDTQRGQ